LALASAGAKVVVSGRREEEGRAVELAIKRARGDALFVNADISREADVKVLVDKTVAVFGRLNIAFNNAGIEGQKGLTTDAQTVENFDSIFNIDVKDVLLAMKYESVAMLRNGGGSVINPSSIAGQIGLAGGGLYFASKHAVNGLARAPPLNLPERVCLKHDFQEQFIFVRAIQTL
jgi:NAD(P)-dependent dehydrogenase (short-subunit alcohol dehydrogenase family)